jgi:hypothetical protein
VAWREPELKLDDLSRQELIKVALQTRLQIAALEQRHIDIENILIARSREHLHEDERTRIDASLELRYAQEAIRLGRETMVAYLNKGLELAGPVNADVLKRMAHAASRAVNECWVPENAPTTMMLRGAKHDRSIEPFTRDFEQGMYEGIQAWFHAQSRPEKTKETIPTYEHCAEI